MLAVILVAMAGSAAVYAKTASHTDDSGNQGTTGKEVAATTQTALADEPAKTQAAAPETSSDSPKADNSGNYQPTVPASASPGSPPADTSGLAKLSCSLTAQVNADDSVSMSFFAQGPARFTVQEKVSGSWKTIGENVFYTGSGGIDAGLIPAAGTAATVRLLKIENGQYTSVSKEITVSRQDVSSAGGLKTYSG